MIYVFLEYGFFGSGMRLFVIFGGSVTGE